MTRKILQAAAFGALALLVGSAAAQAPPPAPAPAPAADQGSANPGRTNRGQTDQVQTDQVQTDEIQTDQGPAAAAGRNPRGSTRPGTQRTLEQRVEALEKQVASLETRLRAYTSVNPTAPKVPLAGASTAQRVEQLQATLSSLSAKVETATRTADQALREAQQAQRTALDAQRTANQLQLRVH